MRRRLSEKSTFTLHMLHMLHMSDMLKEKDIRRKSNGFELLPPPAGGPPPSKREVWGFRILSKPRIQPRVQGRNPARFKGGYGVPRGFKGEKSKSPPNPLGLAERVHRPQTVGKDGGESHDYGYSARCVWTNPVFTKTSNGRNAIGSV